MLYYDIRSFTTGRDEEEVISCQDKLIKLIKLIEKEQFLQEIAFRSDLWTRHAVTHLCRVWVEP